ncbi:hypothetical protein ADUPG1_009489, partial [Aduncisulcus paluster]
MPGSSAFDYNGNRIYSVFPSRYHAPPLCLLLELLIRLYDIRISSLRTLLWKKYGPMDDNDLIDDSILSNAFSFSDSHRVLGMYCDNYNSGLLAMKSYSVFLIQMKSMLMLRTVDIHSGSSKIVRRPSCLVEKAGMHTPYVGSVEIPSYVQGNFLYPFLFAVLSIGITLNSGLALQFGKCYFKADHLALKTSIHTPKPFTSDRILSVHSIRNIIIPPSFPSHLYEAIYSSHIHLYMKELSEEMVLHSFFEQARRHAILRRVELSSSVPLQYKRVISVASQIESGADDSVSVSRRSQIPTITFPVMHESKYFNLISTPSSLFHRDGIHPNTLTSINKSIPKTNGIIFAEYEPHIITPIGLLDFTISHIMYGSSKSRPHSEESLFMEQHGNWSKIRSALTVPNITPDIENILITLKSWYWIEIERYSSFQQTIIESGVDLFSPEYVAALDSYEPFSFVSPYSLY